jgi:hypothetical protein
MATVGQVITILQEVEDVSNAVMSTIATLDPALALPVAAITELEALANVALKAWSTASGVAAITVAEVQALKVNLNLDAPTQ